MKKTTGVKWLAVLLVVAGMTVRAQVPAGDQQSGPGGGKGAMPDPTEISKKMLEKFDADKDGKLNVEELTKAIAARPHRGPPAGVQQTAPQGGGQGQVAPANERQPPAPEKIAAKWMEKFDADKDGKLDADELVKAIAARPHHGPPGGGQHGGPQGDGEQGGPDVRPGAGQ